MLAELCKVLVVKRDEQVGKMTKELLKMAGLREENVFMLPTREGALDLIRAKEINLILSEVGRDNYTGRWILYELEKVRLRTKVMFLFYSGGGEEYVRRMFHKYQADGYILIPLGSDAFIKQVKQVLKKM